MIIMFRKLVPYHLRKTGWYQHWSVGVSRRSARHYPKSTFEVNTYSYQVLLYDLGVNNYSYLRSRSLGVNHYSYLRSRTATRILFSYFHFPSCPSFVTYNHQQSTSKPYCHSDSINDGRRTTLRICSPLAWRLRYERPQTGGVRRLR